MATTTRTHPDHRRGGTLSLLLAAAAALLLLARHPAGLTGPDTPAGVGPVGALGRVVAPLPTGRVSSGFGPRPGGFHYGLDLAAPLGTPIRAVAAGEVVEAGPASGFGLWVRVRHHEGTVSVYGHMQTITTHPGARVSAGEEIATVGARGQATGPHLHIEIWPRGDRAGRVDPAGWLTTHGAPLIGGAA